MIPVIEIAKSMRYALGDMQGITVSDYELVEPINQAVNKLYADLGQRHIREVTKEEKVTINATIKSFKLPDDFIRISQVLGAFKENPTDADYSVIIPTTNRAAVKGAYRLVNRNMTMYEGTYYIEYYYVPAKVETLNDNLDVPESMRSWIEQLSLAMYKKDMAMANTVVTQAEYALSGREIPRFENAGHSQNLGVTGVASNP